MSILNALWPRADVTWKQLDQQNAAGWDGLLGIVSTFSGEGITPDKALGIATYYRCVAMIAETLGLLPFNVYSISGNTKRIDYKHPAQRLLHAEPNDDMSAETYRSTMTMQYLGAGNSYSEIEFNGAGDPIALWPIHYSRVEPTRRANGELYYKIHMTDKGNESLWTGKVIEMPKERILHLRGLSLDGIIGMSIARQAAQTLGIRIAAEKYGASYFRNASRPSGIISHADTVMLTPEQKADLRNQWHAVYGGAENVGRVAVLEGGGKYTPIKIDPNEAQFIETMDHNDLEICRWFGMPPWKVGIQDQAKGWGTIEATNTQYVQDCLTIHAVRWESEINRKLLGGYESNYFAKIEFNGLLRGDLQTRQAWYEAMTRIGVYSINEVRELEDKEGIGPDGDKHMVQLNLTTVDKVGADEPEPEPVMPTQDEEVEETDEAEEDDAEEEAEEDEPMAARLRPVILDVASRIIRKRENEFARLAKKTNAEPHAFMQNVEEFMAKETPQNKKAFKPACLCVGHADESRVVDIVGAHDMCATVAAAERSSAGTWAALTEEQQEAEAGTYADAIVTLLAMKG